MMRQELKQIALAMEEAAKAVDAVCRNWQDERSGLGAFVRMSARETAAAIRAIAAGGAK
jgi:hypothetical protein